jgi:two-component system, chemotaxis family, chemotaxis protein CheY
MRTVRMAGLAADRTEEAGNGIEALEKLNQTSVDMILVDVNMPGMGGVEFVKKARQLPSCAATKIIVVSTESAQEFIDGIIASGANGYITKPFTPESFQKQLAQFAS